MKIVFFNEKRNNKPILKRVQSLKSIKTESRAVFLVVFDIIPAEHGGYFCLQFKL